MKKRIVSLLLALVMALSLVPTVAFAGAHDGQVHVIVSNDTYSMSDGAPWDGALVNKWVDIDNSSTMMSCVVDALGEYSQTGAESGYISEINGLSAMDGGSMSGWMGTLNDWFTSEGFSAFTVANGSLSAGDEIRVVYSTDGGEDCSGSWSNNDKTVKSVSFSAGTLDKTFDKDTHAYTLTIPSSTTGVTVTPTASNKYFQVRTFVGETEYKRTAAVSVKNGTVITVKCGDPAWSSMNNGAYGGAESVPAETYTFTVAYETTPATGITLDKTELCLGVGASSALLATVTPEGCTDTVVWSSNNEDIATVDNTGKVTAVAAGTATITAKAGSKEATCAVTVEQVNGNTVTVNVAPATVNVKFYSDVATTQALKASAVSDKGTVKVGNYNYHQYVLTVASGTNYSYRGTDGDYVLGGEQFTVNGTNNETINLLRVNVRYNGASLNQEGEYSFTLKNGENEVVYGTPYVSSNIRYTPTLLIAGVKHNGSAALDEKWLDEFYLTGTPAGSFNTTPSKTTGSAATINLPISQYKMIKVTAPKEADTTFYKQDANYVVEPVTPNASTTDLGMTTYIFKGTAAHSNYQFRSMMDGKVTQAGYLKDGDDLTVTFPDRAPTDTASTMVYDDNSVLLNINEKNKLNLAEGETFKLRAFRAAWEIINTTSANQMIEPDFHYAILAGNDVISITPTTESSNKTYPNAINGNATNNWLNVKAEKAGTAVVAVWYDAIDVYNANPPAANTFSTFGATDPACYGVFVVNVGPDSSVTWNPVSQDGDWDTEFDTMYYTGDNGVFTFKPTGTVKEVTVQNVYGTELSTAKTVNADSGAYAVPVTSGANIITVTTDAGTDYLVVRAVKVNYTVTNNTTSESKVNGAPVIRVGDKVTVSLDSLNMPIPKMSGIYNPGFGGTCKMVYKINGTYSLTGKGTQYDFPTSEYCAVSFVASQAGNIRLGDGYITTGVYGSAPGDHRGLGDNGKPVNTNAPENSYCFGKLPELTIHVEDGTLSAADRLAMESFDLCVGGSTMMGATKYVEFKDLGNKALLWKTGTYSSPYLSITAVPKDYNAKMTLSYWYEGDTPTTIDVPYGTELQIPTGDSFKVDKTKMLNLTFTISPKGGSAAEGKTYHFLIMKGVADEAISKIDAIGTVSLQSKDTIELARAAYQALKATEQNKVTNYATLTAAETKYAELSVGDTYKAVGDSLLALAKKSTPVVNSIGGEWEILGLARSGKLTDEVANAYYANVEKTVKDCKGVLHAKKYTEYSRVVLALTAADFDPTDVAGYDLTAPLTDFDKTVWQGNNGTAFGLLALNSHNYQSTNTGIRQKYVDELLNKQLDNGGWYISSGTADLDTTAMAIQALAPYYKKQSNVKSAVNKALAFLSEKQGANGDYGTSETCAQVVAALSTLGIDAASDSRFVKNGTSVLSALLSYYAEDATYGKGFAHVKESGSGYKGGAYNQMATEQGYYALAAYERMKAGKTALYVMSDVCAGQHTFGAWNTKDAACTEVGSRSRTCAVCGMVETEVIAALGHNLHKAPAVAATTQADGNIAYWQCSRCPAKFIDEAGKIIATDENIKVAKIDTSALATEAKSGKVTLSVTENSGAEEVKISGDVFKTVASNTTLTSGVVLELAIGGSKVGVDKALLDVIADMIAVKGGDVTLIVTKNAVLNDKQTQTIGTGKQVVEIDLSVGAATVTDLKGGKLTVTIAADENSKKTAGKKLVAKCVRADGDTDDVACSYDADGNIVLELTHLSVYMIYTESSRTHHGGQTAKTNVKSGNTGDMGVLIYFGMATMSSFGSVVLVRKRKEHE